MRDRVFWARFNTKSTENAAAVVDIVDLCVTLVSPNSFCVRTRVIFSLYINAIGRASGCTQITRDAFLLSAFVDMKQVLAPITRLHGYRHVWILHSPFLTWDLGQGPPHALYY